MFNRRLASVLLLGFSSGLPLALTSSTLQAWMVNEHVDLTVIGIFSLVGIPYTLKFLWSPLMDRYVPPFLGRRRGWILISQVALALGILLMAYSHPASSPSWFGIVAVLIAFLSASQDISIDAYRTELLSVSELGLGASLSNFGYRMSMLVSGAGALVLSDHLPWSQVYSLMSILILVLTTVAFFSPEPAVPAAPQNLRDAVIEPLKEFFSRPGAYEILVFLILYKMDAVFASNLITAFSLSLGFTKTDIAAVFKVYGLVATLSGTLLGGLCMLRLGLFRSLLFFGIVQAAAGLSLMFLANLGHNYPMFIAAITTENFCSGLGTAAYAAFLMRLCNKKFTATQFALLSSLMALSRVLGGAPTGWIAKNWGWNHYFLISLVIGIPGLLMLSRYSVWLPDEKKRADD